MTYSFRKQALIAEASIIRKVRLVFGFQGTFWIVGVDWGEGPPVPIPNTEVKLASADNTYRVTGREDR